jgi:hypothetical protein
MMFKFCNGNTRRQQQQQNEEELLQQNDKRGQDDGKSADALSIFSTIFDCG